MIGNMIDYRYLDGQNVSVIYLQFGTFESKGLKWLKFIESHDKIMRK